jgi:hypothetical protein
MKTGDENVGPPSSIATNLSPLATESATTTPLLLLAQTQRPTSLSK